MWKYRQSELVRILQKGTINLTQWYMGAFIQVVQMFKYIRPFHANSVGPIFLEFVTV